MCLLLGLKCGCICYVILLVNCVVVLFDIGMV